MGNHTKKDVSMNVTWHDAEKSVPSDEDEVLVCRGKRELPNGYLYELGMYIPHGRYDDKPHGWVYCDPYDREFYPVGDVLYWMSVPRFPAEDVFGSN